MKFKELIKKKSFWAAVSGAVVIILQLCGVKIDAPLVNEILLGICSLLVAVGVMTASEKKDISDELDKKSDVSSEVTNLIGQIITEEKAAEKKPEEKQQEEKTEKSDDGNNDTTDKKAG